MNFLFRRSSLLAATSLSNRALAASILSSDPLHTLPALSSQPLSPIAAGAIHTSPARPRSTSLLRRDLHFSTRPLGFQATDASHAQSAVADFYDEDRPPVTGSQKGADEGLEIAKLGIANEIVGQLAVKGITKLFPIQRAVLEPAMQGRDMIGRAKTGTGKTLAFGIPIMDKILRFNKEHGRGRCPLALILAPTRELARQVEKEFRESAPLDTVCVYGGTPIQQQMRTLNYGVDVVVGTPGRVIDLLNRGALVLSEVQFIVLDEADQMLAVGFADDVESILEKLPLQRQSMMFSATMPPWIRSLTQKHLKNPLTIDLVGENDQKLAEGISLYSIASERYAKPSILAALIKEHAKGGKCIVFTQTKRDADQLSYTMGRSLNCQPLHGDISQQQRERTLASFRDGGFNILIATDVAARGLDIPNVDLVIHYELPNSSEIFVHRSGRTGRAGKKGSAIVIYSQEQFRLVRGIEQDTGCKFTELPKIAVEGGGEGLFGGMGGEFNSYSGGGRMGGQGFGRGGGGYGSGSSYGRPTQSYGGGVGGYGGGASYGRPTQSYGGGIGGYGGGSSYGRPTQSYGGGGGFGSPSHGQFGSQGGPGAAGGSYGSSGFGRPHQSNGGGGDFGTPSAGRAGGYGEIGHDQFGSQGRPGSAGGSYGGSSFGIPHQSNGGGFGSPSSGRAGGYGESGHGQFGSTGGPGSSGGSYGGQSPGGLGDSGRRESTDNSWPGRSSMSSS